MFKIRVVFLIGLFSLPVFLFGQEVVEKIEVQGNNRIPLETILHYFNLRKGYSFDKEVIEQGVEALWASGFFSDISVAVDKGKRGKVIILSLDEYPIIEDVVFETEKKLKKEEILTKLQEKNVILKSYSVYDPQKMKGIRQTIEGILADKGFNQGTVTSETRVKGKFEIDVILNIQEGPRFRIAEIVFEGNPKLPESVLSSAFQYNQEHNLLSWLKGKDFFRKAKLDEDLKSLKEKFREYGYAEARIGKPLIEDNSKRTFFGSKQQMKKIVIPVDAGDRYFVGNIQIIGNDHIPDRQIRGLIHSKKGEIYCSKIITQDLEEIRELYKNKGYFLAQVLANEHLDSQKQRVDVIFDIREGDEIYLQRLHFRGNRFTKDKVLRREMSILEQEKFRLDLFSKSLEKLSRLGIVRITEFPEIRSDPADPTRINVHLKVEERYRDEWQLTGGYSGYQGVFIGGSFSTVNFLGAGEKFELMLEYGDRSKSYIIGFYEPYLFDKLLSFKFKLFNRDVVFPDLFNRNGKGIQLDFDSKVRNYWWAGVGYDLEIVNVDSIGLENNEGVTDQSVSSLSTFVYRNTVDSPFFPTGGMRCLLSCKWAGSELGSDIQFVKPGFEGAIFFPSIRNHIIGFHLKYQFIKPLKDPEIPFWERFYLGGERSVRGYDVYSIGPRDLEGRNIGGEKSLVFNIEYIVPVIGPVYTIFFFDAGNTFRYSEKIDLTQLYWSTGLEVRLRILSLPIPIRLIFACNIRPIERGDSRFAFRVAFGTSF